jgi:serine protease Do
MSWLDSLKSKLTRRLLVPVVAVGTIATLGTYEFAKPAHASAPAPAPAAAPLDDNSVSALLALDHAMETVAAKVTPATVNVTVTSKKSDDDGNGAAMQQDDNGNGDNGNENDPFSQFFGQQFGPFGKRFFRMQPQGPQVEHGLGSGVIISPDGYIVTNNHVVDGATDIRVTTTDKRILPAKLIGRDKLTDLAVIKVNATDLPSVPLGDSTKLRPGQTVLAFGNPLGFRFTVTRGIISALNRPNPSSNRRAPGEFIQTDAAINPGNSGGPLVDAHGEVVGINTFLVSETGGFSGMGFAIPTQIVKPTVDALIKNGKVEHGYIGIGISDVTPDEAKFFDVKNASGAVVSQVEPDSPGAKAGLKVGDVVTELNGKTVNDAGELQVEVGQKAPGTKLDLTVMRDGKIMQVPVTLEAMGARDKGTETSSAENGKPRWGIGLEDLTPEIRQQVNAPNDVHGAVIEKVVPGSSADDAGLQQGDVITEVNRHPVHSAADVQRELASVPKGQDALVLVWTPNGGSAFIVLHPTNG